MSEPLISKIEVLIILCDSELTLEQKIEKIKIKKDCSVTTPSFFNLILFRTKRSIIHPPLHL